MYARIYARQHAARAFTSSGVHDMIPRLQGATGKHHLHHVPPVPSSLGPQPTAVLALLFPRFRPRGPGTARGSFQSSFPCIFPDPTGEQPPATTQTGAGIHSTPASPSMTSLPYSLHRRQQPRPRLLGIQIRPLILVHKHAVQVLHHKHTRNGTSPCLRPCPRPCARHRPAHP